MKIKSGFNLILLIALSHILFSCMSAQLRMSIAEESGIANIRQPSNEEKLKDTVKSSLPSFVSYKDENGVTQIIGNSERDSVTGEDIMTFELAEVTVVSKSKTVPERNGNINIAFVLTIPKDYLQNDFAIRIYPILSNEGKDSIMKYMYISGREHRTLMARHNFYDPLHLDKKGKRIAKLSNRKRTFNSTDTTKYLSVIDSIENRKIFLKNKDSLFAKSLHLDTIVFNGKDFEYYYSEDISTRNLRKKVKLSFLGEVEDMSGRKYKLKQGDTINYFITSMTQFLDFTPRYKRTIIERRATAKASANISFLTGSSEVIDTLEANKEELQKVVDKMIELNNSNEFIIDSITMDAGCSPEGDNEINKKLSLTRAQSLKRYLSNVLESNAEAADLVQIVPIGENWKELKRLIKMDENIYNRSSILDMIDTTPDNDRKEQLLSNFSSDYEYIFSELYPKLRVVNFTFHNSRRNMVQDTIYSTTIDTVYASAIKMMDNREYKEALQILGEYNDYNTAICYMSLGYNKSAVEIFSTLPVTADTEYMMAILSARLGDNADAIKRFLHACKMDESKAQRGEMDPELAVLIKRYNLTQQLY